MPFQKRPRETTATPPSSPPPPIESEDAAGGSAEGSENHEHGRAENDSDSDGISYSSGGEKDEFIFVDLGEIRKEVQCPICLGVIRKTRTVMECLHRFCRECIDKSMRLGNNECPACRTHCASRRSLRDDPNYDALIAALYPDIEKYEEEDLAFHEEEKARNKQIQDSIAETSRRQAEALGKKRASSRSTSSTYHRRQGNYRNVSTRRNHRVTEHHGSDEDEGGKEHDDVSKDSTSTDEHFAEVRSKRYKKRGGGARASQPSSGGAKGGYDGNDSEGNRDVLIGTSSVGPIGIGIGIGCTDFLGWGRGGLRSSLRNGGLSWGNNRPSRNKRLAKLVKYLQCSHENNEMLKPCLMIVPLHEDKMPCLKQPYLSSSPTSSVGNLCQYVAAKTCVGASEIEILIVKDSVPIKYTSDAPKEKKSATFDPSYHELQLLNENQTLEEIHTQYNEPNLVLAYRLKERPQVNL